MDMGKTAFAALNESQFGLLEEEVSKKIDDEIINLNNLNLDKLDNSQKREALIIHFLLEFFRRRHEKTEGKHEKDNN